MAPSPTICYHYPTVSTSFSQFLEGEFPMVADNARTTGLLDDVGFLGGCVCDGRATGSAADGPVKKALAKRARRARFYDQVATTDEQREKIRKIEERV